MLLTKHGMHFVLVSFLFLKKKVNKYVCLRHWCSSKWPLIHSAHQNCLRICHHGPICTNYIEIDKAVIRQYNMLALVANLPPLHN